jgi:hypothetical protein
MIDINEICEHEILKGNCVALLPSLGIFSVDGNFLLEGVHFVHSQSITGVADFLNNTNFNPVDVDDLDKSLKLFYGGSIRNLTTSLTLINKQVFLASDLAILTFDPDRIDNNTCHEEDIQLLNDLSNQAFNALNGVRFIHCDLSISDRLPYVPGVWNHSEGYMGMLVVHHKGDNRIIAGRVMGGTISHGLGIGLESDDVVGLDYHPYLLPLDKRYNVIGEVGRMIKHALIIFNKAMYSNNETLKFITIMALFEYLGTGNKYTKFQKVRTQLQAHLAIDRNHYDSLSEMFQLYTSRIVDTVNVGYRTKIIHEGALIEDIVPNIDERKKLFLSLSELTKNIILGMYPCIDKSFAELQDYRKTLLNKIGITN